MHFAPETTLVLVAIKDELPAQLLPEWLIAYTGVGKVNATLNAMAQIEAHKPQTIINYGSAGALKPEIKGIVEATQFFQRDMDVRPLGCSLGETPFEAESAPIDFGRIGFSIGTGDNFATQSPELKTDIVDMEAYALAKVARYHAIPFYCFKYISDKADAEAPEAWQENLAKGANAFVKMLNN